ncbi:Ig-like domain-containing protein [Actinomadura sp. HBU206391]|uniref:L,D-transpeptidase n=1 Tax=Actinomadura sp. HBU206391 TaxID=2731692 RepID=UPI00164F81B2|nr:Ig-like domain-containing protein [Actinomadura sp. HBU206391]MBC6459842.1 L,D-transpeptidase family protein [Actinomadura sp. HBU206391]
MSAKVRIRLVATGGAVALAALTAACGGGGGVLSSPKEAVVTITPANGAGGAKPDAPIEVKVADGTLSDVTVRGDGVAITGETLASGTQWRSGRTLTPGTSYTVTAQAKGAGGKLMTATSTFTTLKPARTFGIADITPGLKGETVGVGMPIMVRFTGPVTKKAAVERALEVKADKPVEGAWRWIGSDQVVYRTKTYWPAHQNVRFTARLAGLQGATGVYGMKDTKHTIKIGAAQITTGGIGRHQMTVTRDGRKLRTIPFSAGNGQTREFTTTSGVHLLMEKGNPVTMISPGKKKGDPGYYKTVVDHAVRFSNSGEYVHSAPWSVGSQGSANVSHGCLNVSPANARWFYSTMQRGDVIKLTGSDREVEWNNGWSFWQLSFAEWKKGSALR